MDNTNIQFQTYLKKISAHLYEKLTATEELGLFFQSEESLFLRFNGSKIRQNTTVTQHELALTFQSNQKVIHFVFNLTMDLSLDLQIALSKIDSAREQLGSIEISDKFVPLVNNGHSEKVIKVERPSDIEIPQIISNLFEDSDLAGLWCSGPLRRASLNSKGQFHYFESDYFFFDFSIYNGPKATKGFYADSIFDLEKFVSIAQSAKDKLKLLSKKIIQISKGSYRAYLEPMAVAEILGTMSWNALSQSSYNQGRAPLKKLKEKESLLSNQFTLVENFKLGLCPLFNSIGEVSSSEVELIKNGELINLLTSTTTAKEYQLKSNFAQPSESPRSPEIKPGLLDEKDILDKLGTGLYISNLHYINWSDLQTARLTGMTRFACFWVENGVIQGPIEDLRFDETIYQIFGQGLEELTSNQHIFVDSSTYQKRSLGVLKVPGILVKQFNFVL